MCGINGVFDLTGRRPVDPAALERMRDRMVHRGPDGAGTFVEPGVGLGHRRLSIIDLAGGRQPLTNEDGSVVVVYNGEIYNFADLFRELADRGHVFRTRCDTEVIVHAWEEWGAACVERFRGMFAFAIFDRGKDALFLARDRLGIKPLYYAQLPDGRLLFASELKALLEEPGLPRELDPQAIEEYLALGYVPDPRCVLRHAAKLPPGHTLLVRRGAPLPRPERYWRLQFDETEARREDVERELVERLDEAVAIRLIAEVPLGAFLSGGVDSSAVVALMSRHSTTPVQTCCIAFDDRDFDESSFAELIVQRYGTDHEVARVDPNDFSLIDRLVEIYDEPFADSSAMPTYRVCELARRRVTVALSGDGGDENFAGYRRHRLHIAEQRVRDLLPAALREPLFGSLGAIYPKADWAPRLVRAKSTLQSLARDPVAAYFHSVSVIDDDTRDRLRGARLNTELQGYRAVELFRRHAAEGPEQRLSQVQYLDFMTYLPGDILTKVDRASMAHSLEVRVPVLDHRFVEWVARVPPALKLSGGEGKAVFKSALRSMLPAEVLYRKKMGFSIPLARWFRGPLLPELRRRVPGSLLADACGLDPAWMRTLVDRHASGRRDHGSVLWSLLMLDGFARRVLGTADADC